MSSINKTRIIKIKDNKVFFTPVRFILISQTNIAKASFTFNSRLNIFWKIELQEYNSNTKLLTVKVIDYSSNDYETFLEQTIKKEVEYLDFGKLDWNCLEPLLSSYTELTFKDLVIHTDSRNTDNHASNHLERKDFFERESINTPVFSILDNDSIEIPSNKKKITFKFPFSKAIFKEGYVYINKKLENIHDKNEYKIFNSNILPEFDYIKKYFAKAFKSKTFNVTLDIEIQNGLIKGYTATSPEIGQINKDLIDLVKHDRIICATQIIQDLSESKSLFTANEILSKIDGHEMGGNIFKQTEEEIIRTIIEKKDIRNRLQLEYLAGYKHNPIEKIRFTLKPIFGYLFFIKGKKMNHFCWELLNSHATYLWSNESKHMALPVFHRLSC